MKKLTKAIAVLGFISVEGVAFAAPSEREQCASSAEDGQRLRDEGHYRAARKQLLSCARSACPGFVQKDCSRWLSDVERDAPTVVLGAKDPAGQDIIDATVSIDGEPLVTRLDGIPVMVDVGEHTLTFRLPNGSKKDQRVVIRAAEKSRAFVVTLDGTSTEAAPAKEGAESDTSKLVVPIALAGVGLLALGSYAFFGLSGKSGYDDLEGCKPGCSQDAVSSVDTKFLLADISLGIAVVSFASATYLYLTRPKPAPKSGTASSHGRLHIDGGILAGGGYGSIGGAF